MKKYPYYIYATNLDDETGKTHIYKDGEKYKKFFVLYKGLNTLISEGWSLVSTHIMTESNSFNGVSHLTEIHMLRQDFTNQYPSTSEQRASFQNIEKMEDVTEKDYLDYKDDL